jgi:hypothetical protein
VRRGFGHMPLRCVPYAVRVELSTI